MFFSAFVSGVLWCKVEVGQPVSSKTVSFFDKKGRGIIFTVLRQNFKRFVNSFRFLFESASPTPHPHIPLKSWYLHNKLWRGWGGVKYDSSSCFTNLKSLHPSTSETTTAKYFGDTLWQYLWAFKMKRLTNSDIHQICSSFALTLKRCSLFLPEA